MEETFLTTEEVLAYLQVNLRTVYRLIKAGKIPAVRVGRQWRFRKRDIDAWLDSQRPRDGSKSAPPPAPRPVATGTARPRVLVVDDEASIRDLLAKTLALAEYDVDVAPDGRSALERMRLYPYDLLIADLKMPGMDGLTVIREAKRYKADLPVIIITGFSTESSAIEAVNLGVAGGYLPQDGLSHAGRSVFDEASGAFAELLAIKAEMHALEARLGDPAIPEAEHDDMLHRYSDLQDRFRLNDGYSIELKTATVLQGLGFKTSEFERRTETFSGGWQMRIALSKLLLGAPNLLLLDEPTNHLDLEARNWLEEYLNGYPYADILESHDRFFLDAVAKRIAHLTLRQLTVYHTQSRS